MLPLDISKGEFDCIYCGKDYVCHLTYNRNEVVWQHLSGGWKRIKMRNISAVNNMKFQFVKA